MQDKAMLDKEGVEKTRREYNCYETITFTKSGHCTNKARNKAIASNVSQLHYGQQIAIHGDWALGPITAL